MKHSKLQAWSLTALAAALFLLALQAGKWSAPQDNPHSPTLAGPQKNTVYIALALTAAIAASAAALRGHIRGRTEKLNLILAEQELMRQRDKARMYLDIAAVIIVAIDADGNVSLINKKGAELLALEENQIVGKNWFENFVPERIRSQTQEVFTKLIAGKIEIAKYSENPIVSADGKEKLVAWHNTLVKDPDGKIIGTLSSGLDITGHKTAETTREKLLKELQSKNEELESIIYITSHDLKSPLINIQGFAGELKKSCDRLAGLLKTPAQPTEARKIESIVSDEIPESLSFIISGAAKMDALLSGLLRLERIGRASVSIAPVDMNRLVKNLLRTFEFQMRKQQANIEVTELPNCTGDATLISQVFSNLIDNAIKYRRPDTPLQIRIEGKIETGRAVFAVTDNGIGIEPQHHEKIFEIFHQLQPANSSGGQGLGLTIVRRILDRLDGRVRVQSEPGKGSTFIVELPAA